MKKITYLSFVAAFFLLSVAVTQAQSSYKLEAGWNLVSADVVFTIGKDRNVCDRIMKDGAMFAFHPLEKKYYGGSGSCQKVEEGLEKIVPALPNGDESAAALGFWLYVPRETPLGVDFSVAGGVENKYEKTNYQLKSGWNLIGITSLMPGKSLTDVRGSCSLESVYHFEHGRWSKQSTVDLEEKFTDDSLGYALAIKVANDCAFNFGVANSIPQIPSIPE